MFKLKKKEEKTEEMVTAVAVKKPKKKIKKRYIVLGVVGVLVVLSVVQGMVAGNRPLPVQVKSITTGNLTQTLDTSGVVESEEIKQYFAKTSGQIESLSTVLGSSVKAGDQLLTYNVEKLELAAKQAELETKASGYGIDATITSLNYTQTKAAEAAKDYDDAVKYVQHYTDCVNSIKGDLAKAAEAAASVEKLSADLKNAQAKLEEKPASEKRQKKVKDLSKELTKATKEAKKYDTAALNASLETCSADLAAYQSLKSQYEATKESDPGINSQKAQQATLRDVNQLTKAQAEDNLAAAREGVKAEFDGIVTSVMAVEGQTVMEGTELFTLANDKKVKVTIEVSKYDLAKIALNQKADIEINNHKYVGYVAKIDRFAHANQSGASVLNADIHIDNPDDNIYLGIEGKVSIQAASVENVVLAPIECVNSDTEGDFCYVVEDNKVVRKELEVGIFADEYVEVKSGLKAGDKVIAEVTGDIVEGIVVTAVEEKVEEESGNAAVTVEKGSESETDDEAENE